MRADTTGNSPRTRYEREQQTSSQMHVYRYICINVAAYYYRQCGPVRRRVFALSLERCLRASSMRHTKVSGLCMDLCGGVVVVRFVPHYDAPPDTISPQKHRRQRRNDTATATKRDTNTYPRTQHIVHVCVWICSDVRTWQISARACAPKKHRDRLNSYLFHPWESLERAVLARGAQPLE